MRHTVFSHLNVSPAVRGAAVRLGIAITEFGATE